MVTGKSSYVEIDLEKLEENVNSLKKKVGQDIRIMSVIKADAYGHGAKVVREKLYSLGIKDFAVAILEEALEIREDDKESSIFLLGYTDPSFAKEVLENNITVNITSYDEAKEFSDYALSVGGKIKIGICVDTGMNRIGYFSNDESLEEVVRIANLEGLIAQEMFTHYSMSDVKDTTFTDIQTDAFIHSIDFLKSRGVIFNHYHSYNSGAILNLDGIKFDTIRPGIIQYGYYPSEEMNKDEIKVSPILTWKTKIAQIREVESGSPVSYSNTYVTERRMKIATMPVGYADGYNRLLSNEGFVFVRGVKCPIIGRVCMDLTMIDVTDVEGVSLGDEIILLGKTEDDKFDADDMASVCNTISYEILCDISSRVERKYKNE